MDRTQNASADAGPSTGPPTGPARVKKKAKAKAGKAVARQSTLPRPFLALAPAPVSLTGSRFHEAISSSSLGNLVLPSSYPRGIGLAVPPGPMVMTSNGPSRHAPTGKTRKYAAGFLAPPTIMPGGVSASPRVQVTARNGRRTPGETPEDVHRNRSNERLRQISGSGANASMMSLGHIGRLLESDPSAPQPIQLQDNGPVPEQVSTRRRRRVVRAEEDNIRRRTLTVSTREEGRAMGLARGASMRRVNVWDDLPEPSEPPPAFPFPTTATSRLPPTFETAQSSPPPSDDRPRSPPPSFEQAIGLAALPVPLAIVNEADEEEPQDTRPDLPTQTATQEPETSRPTSPATDYASAPESPTGSMLALPETDVERSDRQMWNMDLLSGYTLEERVRREMVRRKSREEDGPLDLPSAGASSAESSDPLAEAVPPEEAATASAEPAPTIPAARPKPLINTTEDVIHASSPSSPARRSPASVSTPRASIRTLHLSRSTSRLSSSPKTPTAKVSSPAKDLAMASTLANPPTAIKSRASPISPTAPSSPLSVLRQSVQSPKTGDPEAIIEQSPPSRKLSRGHAIRRSSSVLKNDSGSIRSRQSTGSPKQPLFSSPGLTASQILGSPEPHRVAFEHRASDSSAMPSAQTGSGAQSHQRTMSQPNLQSISEVGASSELPPHREAALKRRDLGAARVNTQSNSSAPTTPVKPVKASHPSGPLIDFNHTLPTIPDQSVAPKLGDHSAWTSELLQLLDEVQSPVAESSSQGAARTAAAAIVKAEVEAAVEAKIHEQRAGEKQNDALRAESPTEIEPSSTPNSGQKRAPPPPPPLSLRLKRQQAADKTTGVVRRLSVLSTANSPIIPLTVRPSTFGAQEESPTSVKGQSVPTRRPPPLPPVRYQPLAEPSAPSPPPPPRFTARPNISHVGSFSTSESSEDTLVVPERPVIPRRPYTSLATRPRGPRPPPVPTRPWNKVVSQSWQETERTSPVATSPPPPLAIRTNSIERPQPPRSTSVQDLRSPRRQRSNRRSPMEFTDLDVFVSRLEGSGREYEGFVQISSFLGPSKPTAATPAQIATLLPGPVSVDSRRTTAQGKVKLKLSILGVRVSKCPICLSQFKDKDTGVMLPECSHVAHQVCATRWFRDESRCFVCREPLKEA